jgi:hypothetical protein
MSPRLSRAVALLIVGVWAASNVAHLIDPRGHEVDGTIMPVVVLAASYLLGVTVRSRRDDDDRDGT